MAIAAHNGWTLNNFYFDQAFLNSVLGEDKVIYLKQPPGYETKDREQWVYRLLKLLYGLKQGSKNWYDALHNALVVGIVTGLQTHAGHRYGLVRVWVWVGHSHPWKNPHPWCGFHRFKIRPKKIFWAFTL